MINTNFYFEIYRNGIWRTLEKSDGLSVKMTAVDSKTQDGVKKYSFAINAKDKSVSLSGLRVYTETSDSLRCTYKPHLTPLEGMIVGEESFRSPVVVLENESSRTLFIPDIMDLKKPHPIRYMLDYDQASHRFYYGVAHYDKWGHVYYRQNSQATEVTSVTFSLYTACLTKDTDMENDFTAVVDLLWDLYGERELAIDEASSLAHLENYVEHTYGWVFDRWKNVCWQTFERGGKQMGAAVFIVTAAQKPGGGKENKWREPKSIWFQAWFCALRSAYGYYMWGRKNNNSTLMQNAQMCLELALDAPKINGFFAGYFAADENNSLENGKWIMSCPRRPENHEDFVHVLDSSWTCIWLLKWFLDIERQERILGYVTDYAEALARLQKKDGSFPAWINPYTLEESPFLMQSPECAMHVTLFSSLYQITKNPRYLFIAERTAEFLMHSIIPEGRWEDFETYWSCSGQWDKKRHGLRDEQSGIYNQCNFSMYWCAEALADLYVITKKEEYLRFGEIALAHMSLYQQLYQPPSFPVEAIGGFGVMNSDDEWNDARQSLFALTYMRYYQITNNKQYYARAFYAMKASFYMMYCPENPQLKELYEKVHTNFDDQDYGFMMENFGHSDTTQHGGLGEFTIFDWGNGAACTSLYTFLTKSK